MSTHHLCSILLSEVGPLCYGQSPHIKQILIADILVGIILLILVAGARQGKLVSHARLTLQFRRPCLMGWT